MNAVKATTKELSDSEKNDFIREVLGVEYASAGNNFPILRNAIDVIGYIDSSLSAAQLIPYVNSLIVSSRLISFVGAGASFASIFLFPVAAMLGVINAYQVGHRMYAYRSIAYTVTAWAFDKPIPVSSNRIILNIREGDVVTNKAFVAEYKKLWNTTSLSVLTKISAELATKGIPKDAMKVALRAAANNNPQELCELIMKGFEKEMSVVSLLTWKRNYNIKFPS